MTMVFIPFNIRLTHESYFHISVVFINSMADMIAMSLL